MENQALIFISDSMIVSIFLTLRFVHSKSSSSKLAVSAMNDRFLRP